MNSDNARFRSASNGRGSSRRDTGLVMFSSRMGTMSSTDGMERWMRAASVKSDADARPEVG